MSYTDYVDDGTSPEDDLPYPATPEELRAKAHRVSAHNRMAAEASRARRLRGLSGAARQNRLNWRPLRDFEAQEMANQSSRQPDTTFP